VLVHIMVSGLIMIWITEKSYQNHFRIYTYTTKFWLDFIIWTMTMIFVIGAMLFTATSAHACLQKQQLHQYHNKILDVCYNHFLFIRKPFAISHWRWDGLFIEYDKNVYIYGPDTKKISLIIIILTTTLWQCKWFSNASTHFKQFIYTA
jgi:hypothetical protein